MITIPIVINHLERLRWPSKPTAKPTIIKAT
jgi:hypothetical protein